MVGNPKFAIWEKDGEEFDQPVEYIPYAEDIKFDEATDLKQKINGIEAGFSWKKLLSGETLSIPLNRQMVLVGELFMETDSEIHIEGDLAII